MALATQCPHCGKRFRVAADQLKLRGGIVRCGACQEIFDGSATLINLDALAAQQAGAAAPPLTTAPANNSPADPAQGSTPAPESDAGPALLSTAPAPGLPSSSDAGSIPPGDDNNGEPIYTLDFDHTFDPFGILPKVEQAVAEPAAAGTNEPRATVEPTLDADASVPPGAELTEAPPPDQAPAPPESDPEPAPEPEPAPVEQAAEQDLAAPSVDAAVAPEAPQDEHVAEAPEPAADAAAIDPTLGLAIDEELVAAALPEHDEFDGHESTRQQAAVDAIAPLPMRESAPADPVATRARARAKAVEARLARARPAASIPRATARLPEADEPEFVKRSREQEESGKTRRILLAAGSAVLLLLLAAQAVTTSRNVLAARFPAARPALAAACAALRCRVELPAQIENLTIDQGELTGLGGSTYSLATLLHNQGALVQAWPHVELTLTDSNDKPLVRRVITPVEYLPPRTPQANGFAAHTEQPVKLHFQLDQLKPSGYSIVVFYP
jgi:predicted Zn finger-like uncharacterized protein